MLLRFVLRITIADTCKFHELRGPKDYNASHLGRYLPVLLDCCRVMECQTRIAHV